MIKDYSKNYNDLTKLIDEIGTKIPETMKGFNDLHRVSVAKGVLPSKTKELMALGIAIAMRCDGCIALHVKDALKTGATSQEIMETISVAMFMGGGPALVYGCQAMDALVQFVVLEQ